ncbi:MAG: bifunctional 5,10-methylenetetrahydrofolate dehydrogenase/5,10-methenyltetrahydrofolate cyclohydrolase [Patescibacteria group bacterium]
MLLNGKKIAEKIKKQLKKQVGKMRQKPGLAVILVGKNPASEIYVKLKEMVSREIGINFKKFLFSSKINQEKIIKLIEKLNRDKKIHGIIIQLPLPKSLETNQIIQKIDPQKDVDGFVPGSKFISPTHQAILTLLKSTKINLKNKKTIILTKNQIFAQPLKNLLTKRRVKTDIWKTAPRWQDKTLYKKYDIIIVALGKPHCLKPSMIKKNSIVIDVGYSRLNGKPVGDVDPKCARKTSFLSPVPGGVGPLTVIFLLKNVVQASKRKF